MSYALITGASKGIGKAIALELAARKIDLLLVARSEDLLKQVASGIREKYQTKADYLPLDLSAPGSARRILEWCAQKGYGVNILVNNAGYGLSGPFEKYSVEENTQMMQVNMIAPVQLCQVFLPMLKQSAPSYILNIASSAAYQAVPYLSIYAASKSFLLSYSRGLRQELASTNVSVTVISPGSTDTDFVVRAQVGPKGRKTAERVNMSAEAVAKMAVNSMFDKKAEMITGLVNKLGAFMTWLMPKGLVEKMVMKIYQ
jgi:uncharacterized protein